MQNIAAVGDAVEISDWQAEIPALKDRYPTRQVVGSIAAAVNENHWKQLADGMLAAGVDALELDVSCSHDPILDIEAGKLDRMSELAGTVTTWVKQVCEKPVIVKLPAFAPNLESVVAVSHEAGAAGVSAINTLPGLLGVDLETLEPLPAVQGYGSYGGLSGPAIKPVALRVVSLLSQLGILPVSGIGGVSTWEDVAEFVLCGATCVQLCTAVMWNGYGILNNLLDGLTQYLEGRGLRSVGDLVGLADASLVPSVFDLPDRIGMVARIVPERCRNCGLCVVACRDGGFQAISEGDGATTIDAELCDGCGLCFVVCPFDAVEWQQGTAG
jgi:dihydropyrimidine dehydrogenase (NAD+) subunit PreA